MVGAYRAGGGLMFGAVFMATDDATSPQKAVGVVIYGVGLGLFTGQIRKFGTMNEGVSFAILLMNIVTPLLEKIRRKPFGTPVKSLRDIAVGVKAKFSRKNTADAAEGGESIG